MGLSGEQKIIINEICNKSINAVINAIPRSGKTELVRQIAKTYRKLHSNKTCLILTYNKHLRKSLCVDLKNEIGIESHTFHSAALYYSLDQDKCRSFTDSLLVDALNKTHVKENMEIENIGCVFVDETQDLIPLYTNYLIHLLKHITLEQKKKVKK